MVEAAGGKIAARGMRRDTQPVSQESQEVRMKSIESWFNGMDGSDRSSSS
jgi:hypothetical protein